MKPVTGYSKALVEHLEREFGGHICCQSCRDIIAPPVGVPFVVLEPLQTEPHPIEEGRWAEFGLTSEQCIPVGIYDGLEEGGIEKGTSTHRLYIKGSKKHGTKRVCIRLASGNIDWLSVRAVSQ